LVAHAKIICGVSHLQLDLNNAFLQFLLYVLKVSSNNYDERQSGDSLRIWQEFDHEWCRVFPTQMRIKESQRKGVTLTRPQHKLLKHLESKPLGAIWLSS
jgi:hypothetical protein